MKRFATLAGGTVAGITALALAVPQLAGAEESPSPGTDSSETSPGAADDRPTPDERREELASRLAEELGLETAEVSAALETVLEDLGAEHREEHLERLSARLGGGHPGAGPFGGRDARPGEGGRGDGSTGPEAENSLLRG